MFDTIYATEMQFRHESDERARQLAQLASIRERRAAEAAQALGDLAPVPSRTTMRATVAGWPRPIGVKDYATTACAVAG